MLTLAQAAAMTGMNRSSILRAIKRGAITGTKDHNEVWHVDGAELARAFPVTPPNTQPKQQDAHTDALVALRADNAPSPESAPYTAIAEALPANVAVEIDRDAGVVNFRVAGNRVSVQAELDRIRRICADRAWLRLMGPIRWGDDYIVHGVLQLPSEPPP